MVDVIVSKALLSWKSSFTLPEVWASVVVCLATADTAHALGGRDAPVAQKWRRRAKALAVLISAILFLIPSTRGIRNKVKGVGLMPCCAGT